MRHVAVTVVLGLLLLSGCGSGPRLEDVPMPRLVDGPTYEVTARFRDALNLPVDAPVKLDGRTVGQVTGVRAASYRARVTMDVSSEVTLRRGTSAEIRLTAPMGTAYVELRPAQDGKVLTGGAVIPVARTSEAPDVTDLLTALSTVVTGGSFEDISTIIEELNVALTGNADTVRQVLDRLDGAVTRLNRRLPTLDRLTRSLDRLTTRLAGDLPAVTASLDDLSALVETLEQQRGELMGTLTALRRFDATATPMTRQVRADLLDQVSSMRTVLASLLRTRDDIDGMMAGLIAFSEGTGKASPGDFANFDLDLLLDQEALRDREQGDDPAPPQQSPGARQ